MNGLYSKRRKRAEMNLVPLIDVLVMLVFFAFVTMQFKSASTLNITLPKVETAGKNVMKGNVTIAIDKDETVTFNATKVTDDQLVSYLQQAHDSDPNTPVLIKADETTQLRKLAFVWDACRKTGLSNVNIQSR